MTRSALVVLVAEAEPLVDEATAREVAAIAYGIDPFDETFATVGRFDDGTTYLEPQPLEPFRQMTSAFVAAFPDCPPYGGAFPEPHPHLTVGARLDDAAAGALAAEMMAGLSISMRVDGLTLLVEDDLGHWTVDGACRSGELCETPGS